jgi:multicomponent Na+:H+ antiporter subunit E
VESWLFGLPALAGAVWASRRLGSVSDTRLSMRGLLRFIPYFLWESLRGGTDVALRTLAPRVRVQPGFYRYRTDLHASSGRTFFAYCVSLLPGTLTADLQDEWLEIHTLNTEPDPISELARLERLVAGLFTNKGDGR